MQTNGKYLHKTTDRMRNRQHINTSITINIQECSFLMQSCFCLPLYNSKNSDMTIYTIFGGSSAWRIN